MFNGSGLREPRPDVRGGDDDKEQHSSCAQDLDAENEKQSSWVKFFFGNQEGSKSWPNVGMLLHLKTFVNYTAYKSARAELQTWFVMTEMIKAKKKSVQCFQRNTRWCPRFTMFLRHQLYSGTRKSASNRKPLAQLNAVKHNMQNHEKHFTQLCSSISWRKRMANWQTWETHIRQPDLGELNRFWFRVRQTAVIQLQLFLIDSYRTFLNKIRFFQVFSMSQVIFGESRFAPLLAALRDWPRWQAPKLRVEVVSCFEAARWTPHNRKIEGIATSNLQSPQDSCAMCSRPAEKCCEILEPCQLYELFVPWLIVLFQGCGELYCSEDWHVG